ncbi:MAG: hypothetical protein QM760_05755 [Nibricoccus sp.]
MGREHLYEPGVQIAQMSDWPAKTRGNRRAYARSRHHAALPAFPSWLLILAEALRARRQPHPRPRAKPPVRIWPNLECLVHGGVPIGPFHDELRLASGRNVNFHEVYPASEGFIATQDAEPEDWPEAHDPGRHLL